MDRINSLSELKQANKEIKRQNLAQRLFDFIPHWDRVYETVDEVVEDIKNDPESIIEYLMDLLEEV